MLPSILPFSVSVFSISALPKSPISPPSGPTQWLFQKPPAESKFLAAKPGIFNTDQGSQFTGLDWIGELESNGIRISMDGKGRWMDNVFIERLWRSLKYERIRLYRYGTVGELKAHVAEWMSYYNHQRKHQHLGYHTPWSLYEAATALPQVA